MIVRSLPDIDRKLLLATIYSKGGNSSYTPPLNTLFFNSGSSSLVFFLNIFGENKRVGLQVFTCSTVLDAVKRAKDTPVFMDINQVYFTTTYEIVRNQINSIDILILTHLFGIPNPDYIRIKELCIQKGVILIDDLCQTYHAKIGGIFVEDLSDNYFYSFFYDKPISATSGGMLKLTSEFYKKAVDKYLAIGKDSELYGKRLLRKLYWMNCLLSPTIYKKDFRNNSLWEEYLLSHYPILCPASLLRCLLSSMVGKVFCKLGFQVSESPIKRMSEIQQSYIVNRLYNFNNNNGRLLSYCKMNNIPIPQYLVNPEIECSLGKRCIMHDTPEIRKEGVEIALYNWPYLICDDTTEYPEAVSVIRSCINVPLWYNDML